MGRMRLKYTYPTKSRHSGRHYNGQPLYLAHSSAALMPVRMLQGLFALLDPELPMTMTRKEALLLD